jgi:putative phosphoserine phosphatase/1-acylglycerol-3-phosphate O-acyltransferase
VTIDKLLAEIESSEPGPGTAALFDFDGTIIAGYSATVFLQDALVKRELSLEELAQMTRALTSFGLGNMGFSALMAVHAQYLAGRSETDYRSNSERLFRSKIARLIYPETRRLIEAHQAKGHTVAIISSATPYQVEPSAADLGIDRVYSTQLEVLDDTFTGAVIKPTVFGEGKVLAAESLASETGADLDKSFFYSDSIDDIQLLERVGKPVTLNPRKRLKTITEQRHWPSASFDSRGKITVDRFIRSIWATGSLVGSFAAGLPIYALTGSKRDSVNFSISLFADTCNALIGMDLDVHGEEYLWSHRPAVFMFNHQSKADVAIMASLVRRDVVAVGKKEIKRMPVIGQVMGYAGTIFIDRSDRERAIESMKPLITAMREQRKSLVIAPEGTRTPSRKLAPFKKGGFHIAMQVGVPIIPIVIHNAGDIAPKGDFLFRPGKVRVDVLPPVDTSHWSAAKMNAQVTEVRNLFLATLGQPTQSTQETIAASKAVPSDMKPEGKSSRRRKKAASHDKAIEVSETKASKPKRKTSTKTAKKRRPPKTSATITTPAKSGTAKRKTSKPSAVRPKRLSEG